MTVSSESSRESHPPAAVVIPARYASTRLPGKPLLKLQDKLLVQYIYEAARKATLVGSVLVATDDERIKEAVECFGGEAVMTSPDHPSGTDRVAEVARSLAEGIIINVQGDEPEVLPEQIDQVARLLLEDRDAVMSTLACELNDRKLALNPNLVKVVIDKKGSALYFSRAPIPYARDEGTSERWLQHVGIYGYRREFLLKLSSLKPTPLERTEKLEQLRALENGFSIKVGITDHVPGIDTLHDYKQAVARIEGQIGRGSNE